MQRYPFPGLLTCSEQHAAARQMSFHPLNAALLLTASLTLLAKVERRRAQNHPDGA